MYLRRLSLLNYLLSCFCLLLAQALLVNGRVYCSARSFGYTDSADCSAALLNLPENTEDQFFVEQQLRTALPTADWRPFVDSRPPAFHQVVVQTPKLWSHSQCGLQYEFSISTNQSLQRPVTLGLLCTANCLFKSP